MKRFKEEGLFPLLIFAFLAFRLSILLTSAEYVSLDEELCRGTIGKELIEGLKTPLWNYRPDPLHGGTLVVGVLAAPFFLLLGTNLFALKLVPLLFSLAALLLTFFFLKRFFSKRAALFACAILVLPPPVFTELSFSAMGTHAESILLTCASLFFFYRYLYEEKGKGLSLILFGLSSGLGFWFAPITLVTTLACLSSWFLLNRRSFLSRDLLFFCLSFCVGALPAIYCGATHDLLSTQYVQEVFLWGNGSGLSLEGKLAFIPTRLVRLVLDVLPFSFQFRRVFGIPSYIPTLLYGLTAFLLLAPFIWREGRKALAPIRPEETKLVPLLLFPFLYLFLYSATVNHFPGAINPFHQPVPHDFVALRYFSPLYYFLFLLLALSISSRKNPLPPLLFLLGLGLLGQCSLLFNEPMGRALHYKGYSYLWLGDPWRKAYPFPDKFSDFRMLASQLKEPERRFLYREYAHSLALEGAKADPETILKSIQHVPQEYRPFFIENLGHLLGTSRADALHENLALAKRLPEEEQPFFYFGLATGYPGSPNPTPETFSRSLYSIQQPDLPYREFYYFHLGRAAYNLFPPGQWKKMTLEVPDFLAAQEQTWLYRGMGTEAGYVWISSPNFKRPFDPIAAKLSPKAQAEFFWGVGWGLGAAEMYEDRTRLLDWISRLEERHQAWALKGFEAYEEWYGFGMLPA